MSVPSLEAGLERFQRGKRVWVVQSPSKFNYEADRFEPKYDLTPAARYGELTYILPPGNIRAHEMEAASEKVRAAMREFLPGDSILAVGDPVAIAMVAIEAAAVTGNGVVILKWDRRGKRYEPFTIPS